MQRRVTHATALAVLLALSTFAGAKTPTPSPPTAWVTDNAGFLSDAAVRRFNGRLRAYEQRTGHQLILWIGTTLGDEPIEDWAAATFKAWRVGRERLDDGLAIFIFAQDRKIRIEVGYGLEGVVTDAQSARVIAQMVERVRAGDHDGAVGRAITALTAMIGGGDEDGGSPGPEARGGRGQPQPQVSLFQAIILGILGIFVLIFLITHPRLALLLLMSSGRRGGGGWGGGGFSGGGGSSGGGGATGSW